jgi:energy-coupling factor transporter ATP-binding protein EcfA2
MHLESLRIINFRGYVDETISFAPSTVFVGANGAGKSTILDAIRFLLGEPDPLGRTWNHGRLWCRVGGSEKAAAAVIGTFSGLTEVECTAWRRALDAEGRLALGNLVTAIQERGGVPYVLIPTRDIDIDDKELLNAAYMQVEHLGMYWIDLDNWGQLPEVFRWTGHGPDLEPVLPVVVSIPGPEGPMPAFHEVLHPLLRVGLLGNETMSSGIVQSLDQGAGQLSERLATTLSRSITEYVPSTSRSYIHSDVGAIGFWQTVPWLESVLAGFVDNLVMGGQIETSSRRWLRDVPSLPDVMGGGTHRAYLLSLLEAYRDPELWAGQPAVLLLIEEPEAGLHPEAQRRVAALLRELPGSGVQSVVVSHSAAFINAASSDGQRLVTRSAGGRSAVVEPEGVEEIRRELGISPADALLGSSFVICEGVTDVAVFREWARTIGADLDESGVRLTDSGGWTKANVVSKLALLAMEGTRIHVILDGGEGPERTRRELERVHGEKVRVHLLDVPAIEEYFSRGAVAAWLAVCGHPDDPLDGFEVASMNGNLLEWLHGCSNRVLQRGFSKADDGKVIARMTLPEDIPERVRAILAQILPPTSQGSR